MMDYACVHNAAATIMGAPKTTHKAIVIDWQDVVHTDPDVVVIGCCGFDLARNIQDVVAKQQYLCQLRAGRNQRIYASDGNRFIAQPGKRLRRCVCCWLYIGCAVVFASRSCLLLLLVVVAVATVAKQKVCHRSNNLSCVYVSLFFFIQHPSYYKVLPY